jgi:hypothetical protein
LLEVERVPLQLLLDSAVKAHRHDARVVHEIPRLFIELTSVMNGYFDRLQDTHRLILCF